MTPEQLRDILKGHMRFVRRVQGGKRADLRGQDLSGLKLPGINLEHAILAGINLSQCVLTGANFGFTDLFGANFEGADISEANFLRADLRGAKFLGANMKQAVLEDADLRPGSLIAAETHKNRADLADDADRRRPHRCRYHQRRPARSGDDGPGRHVIARGHAANRSVMPAMFGLGLELPSIVY